MLLLLLFSFVVAGIYALTSNDIKVGTNIEVDGAPWRVLGTIFWVSFFSCIYVIVLLIVLMYV